MIGITNSLVSVEVIRKMTEEKIKKCAICKEDTKVLANDIRVIIVCSRCFQKEELEK